MMTTAPVVPPIVGWTTELSCGHKLVLPADGAVLANVATIVHHDRLCPGPDRVPPPETRPAELEYSPGRRPNLTPTILPAAPPHLELPAAP